jgi:hypothetical protein
VTAPALIAYAETTWTGSGAKSTGSITWQAGDLIVVLATNSNASQTIAAPTATGLTFTDGGAVGTSGVTDLGDSWSAVAAAGGTQAVSSTCATFWGMAVWVWRGSAGIGNRATSITSAKTVSLVRSGGNSCVVLVSSDFAAAAVTGYSFTPAAANDRQHVQEGSTYSVYAADFGDQGSAGTASYGTTGETSSGPFTSVALEILGTAGGTANAGLAAGAGAAPASSMAQAGLAAGSGSAQQPAGHIAGLASGTGTAQPAAVSTVTSGTANAGLASGAGAAAPPGMAQAGLASGSGAAQQPAGHNAGLASGTGAAQQPAVAVSGASAHAGLASGAGAAWLPYAAGSTTPHSAEVVRGVESAFYARSGAEAGQGAEGAQMLVSGTDSCHAADRAAKAWPSAADAVVAADVPLKAWPGSADTSHGADAALPARFTSPDTGHAADAVHETGIWTFVPAGVRLLVPYRHDRVRAARLDEAAMRLAERGGWARVTRLVRSADAARCQERALAERR